ncbi:DUF1772 domain-containing protein [Rhizohabitans arisaemae]|uniref:anthrone oxygenase family protein n=1 Tax=Rhizohabitans arisaemae TaxID=2720610 RepID=UPI0024B1B78E|nr:DUF1772 domain-containing protein [Rhizohabitans arisaemae]
MTGLLSVVALLGGGLIAGVLFAVALSTVPALMAMPPGRYIYTHKLLGRNWDPTMPAIVLTTTAADVALVFLAPGGLPAALFLVAAVLLLGVSVVSHLCNVPINRQMRALDPEDMPGDWTDPRPLWRRWHLLRTALAVLALVAGSVAATLT